MTLGFNSDLPTTLWNPPLPPLQQVHRSLLDALAKELAGIPIQQQTVIIAVRWDLDGWSIDILFEPPPRGRYDGFAGCLVDFDQYYGSIECIRQSAAEALADELMEAAFPQWKIIQEFGSHWEADPPDLN